MLGVKLVRGRVYGGRVGQGPSWLGAELVRGRDVQLAQQRSQNAEKVTHIKGILLYQAVILFNCVPLQIGTSLKGKN